MTDKLVEPNAYILGRAKVTGIRLNADHYRSAADKARAIAESLIGTDRHRGVYAIEVDGETFPWGSWNGCERCVNGLIDSGLTSVVNGDEVRILHPCTCEAGKSRR